jgi:hypothetical protein
MDFPKTVNTMVIMAWALCAVGGNAGAPERRGSAWHLVRHADGSYGHGRVFDSANPRPNPPRGLVATRTIEVSPFLEDRGRVLYFGGYDCADVESHNTAWIYRGELPSKASPK